MQWKFFLPNLVTSLNLVLGMGSIFFTMKQDFETAVYFIFAALIADGMDGRTARFFNASSEIGKEMDSLCDLVSFGVAPGLLAYRFFGQETLLMQLIAICFALCGAWRLARFNVNTTVVHGFFMGLAIPAGGLLVASSTVFLKNFDLTFFPLFVFIVAILMISEVHYPDFKGKGEPIFLASKVFFLVSFLAILFSNELTFINVLFSGFFSYALFGIVNSLLAKMKR